MIVDAEGKVAPQPVKTGGMSGGDFIIAEGLQGRRAGDRQRPAEGAARHAGQAGAVDAGAPLLLPPPSRRPQPPTKKRAKPCSPNSSSTGPIFAWVIALVILLAGGLALRQLPVSQYPAVAPPALAITVSYPGASAQVVEETAVALIEQEMNGIEHLLYMESASELGTGTMTLTFEAGTNLDIASVEAQNRIKRVEARLPEEVRRLGVTVAKSARNYLMFVSLYSPDKSLDNVDLGSFAAANVLENIRRVPGVGEAMLFGTEYSMRLWLKPDKLQAFNLTPADVAKAVRAQNVAAGHRRTGPGAGRAPASNCNAVIVTQRPPGDAARSSATSSCAPTPTAPRCA